MIRVLGYSLLILCFAGTVTAKPKPAKKPTAKQQPVKKTAPKKKPAAKPAPKKPAPKAAPQKPAVPQQTAEQLLIQYAQNKKTPEALRLITQATVAINTIEGSSGKTALHYAVENNLLELVKALIAAGADNTIVDKAGKTAIMYAVLKKHTTIVELLRNAHPEQARNEDERLITGAKNNNLQAVLTALSRGASISAADSTGTTAVWHSLAHGYSAIIEALQKAGADVYNACDAEGNTALMSLVQTGEDELVAYMIEKGAKVNAANKNGVTALMMAAARGKHSIVNILIGHGADVNARTIDGVTVLMFAVSAERPANWHPFFHPDTQFDTVLTLLLYNANANAADNDGVTPLMYAAMRGNILVTNLLIKRGANVNAIDNTGRVVLDYAIAFPKLVSLLIDSGAKKPAEDRKIRDNNIRTDDITEEIIAYAKRFGDYKAEKSTPYERLGLTAIATRQAVHKRCRDLFEQYHPDHYTPEEARKAEKVFVILNNDCAIAKATAATTASV